MELILLLHKAALSKREVPVCTPLHSEGHTARGLSIVPFYNRFQSRGCKYGATEEREGLGAGSEVEGQRRQHPGCTPAWLGPSWGLTLGAAASPRAVQLLSPGPVPFLQGPAGEPGVGRPSLRRDPARPSSTAALLLQKSPSLCQRSPGPLGPIRSKRGEKAASESVGKRLGNPDMPLSSDCFPKQRAPGPADPACGRRRGHGGVP